MKKQYIIFLFIFFVSCSGEVLVNRTAAQNQSSSKKYDITGHWKFVYAVKEQGTPFLKSYPNPNTPAREVGPPEPPYIGPDFVFEGDSAMARFISLLVNGIKEKILGYILKVEKLNINSNTMLNNYLIL